MCRKISIPRLPFSSFRFILFLFFSFSLLSGPGLSLATAPAQTATTSANFQMGTDATVMLDRLAGPDGDQAAAEIAGSGGGWVRLEFKATDPTNLKRYDRAISRLQVYGVRILAVLVDPFATCHSDIKERDTEVFARWVREVYLKGCGQNTSNSVHQLGFNELTERYSYIQHWQLWNEPNVCGFLRSDLDACGYGLWRRDVPGGERVGVRYGMQKFGTLLATVYAERTNKQVKIVTGGILSAYNCSPEYETPCNTDAHRGPENCYKLLPWENYGCDAGVNLLVNAEAVQRYKQAYNRFPFDILGLHPYQFAAWANGYVAPAFYVTQDIQRNVRRFVDNSYPIWISEWGFDLATTTNQPAACQYPVAASTVQGCEANIATLLESMVAGINVRPNLNITNLFWYNYADQTANIQAGLLDQTGRKRASYFTFQGAAQAQGLESQQQSRRETLGKVIQLAAKLVSSQLS
ncbi:MAG: hypothetical protein JWP00_2885 [Chloroflexi bacterium]|jgi:hypothetical protein|nr:hypothetical protein [Chloroflexota bacterium]